MGPPPPLPSGLAAAPSRPLPHFTAPPSLRPSRAPLPAAQQPLSASSRPARKESLRAQGRDSEGVAMDGRGFLEAALENRRLAGVPLPTSSAGARPLREVQPPLQEGRDELVRVGRAHEAHVGTWEDQAGADDQYEETEVLRSAPPNQDDVALTTGKVDLSRMTSTRRYMAELDEDDDPVGADGDRATWHSAAWESEARDSVASLEPLQQAGLGSGLKGSSRLGLPRDSTLTTGSVDADPFSYSVYASLPSPRDSAFPPDLIEPVPSLRQPQRPSALPALSRASNATTPVVRIGPPSPTTEAFLQNPHDSAIWSEVLPARGPSPSPPAATAPLSSSPDDELLPPPSLSQSTGRVRSQVFASAKNFSRPFVPAAASSPAPPPSRDLAPIVPPARRPSSPRTDTTDTSLSSPLDRSSSLGHASLLDRSSSMGHSSQTSHSTHALAWDDGGRARMQEEAKRAIALARSKSQRAIAGRDFALDEEDERDTSVEELRSVRDEAPRESDDFLDAYAGEEEEQSPASIHFPQFAPPPSVSAYSASEYRDSTTQYASYAPNEPPQPLYDTPSSLAPSSHPLYPVTPAPFLLSLSSPVPSSFSHSTFSPDPTTSQAFSPPPPSPPRQRKVLRKPRPPAARDKAASQAMGRSLSASSSTPSEPAKKEGVWSRFRARSRSRGASERPDPGLWAQERPPVPPMLHAHSSPLLVSDLSASLPALSSRFLASPSPSSRAGSPASTPASHSPIPTPSSAPLSQAEFARLAARPAFPHRGASARSAPEAEWVLKSVEGARTVQAGMAPAGGGARAVVVHRGAPELAQLVDDEVEHLSEALAQARTGEHPQGHDRAASGAQSLYSKYSFYSLPQSASPTSSAPPASPTPASPAPTSSAPTPAPAPAPTQGHVARQPSTMSTLQKLDLAIASGTGASRPSVVGRTASGKEIRRDPVTPDDYLQLGIDLHERGELERAAWCFEQSARRNGGCGAGMLMYGLSLRHGWGCQVNAQLGFRFLQMAAESVVADLDRVVFGGRTLSEAEANTKAAKSELVLALHEIGASYRFGWGVEKSKKMAVSYFKLAADLGDVDAQQDLAFALANGKGCKKDLKEAARYYRLAIAQGASDFGLSWVWKDKYLDA